MQYLKSYKIRENHAVINLKYGGVDVECQFKNGNVRIGQWARLRTSNEIVQRAIENSDLYGKIILPDGQPIPMEEEKKTVDPADITTLQQLRDYLVSEYGCDRSKIGSPNALKSKVKEFGLELPNMVW